MKEGTAAILNFCDIILAQSAIKDDSRMLKCMFSGEIYAATLAKSFINCFGFLPSSYVRESLEESTLSLIEAEDYPKYWRSLGEITFLKQLLWMVGD